MKKNSLAPKKIHFRSPILINQYIFNYSKSHLLIIQVGLVAIPTALISDADSNKVLRKNNYDSPIPIITKKTTNFILMYEV